MKRANQRFEGNWELLEWTAETPGGKVLFPFGTDAIGRITYDPDGLMAVQIMRSGRNQFSSDDPLEGDRNEKAAAYDGYMAYCGSYQVDENHSQVIHHIEISSFPNWTGQIQVRNYEFMDDRLILSTPAIGSRCHRLVWRKVKPV